MLAEFKDPEIEYVTLIWLARAQIKKNDFKDASESLLKIEERKNVKEFIDVRYYSTMAELYIASKKYKDAIEPLETALELERKRKKRIRYHYILAQLGEQIKDYKLATKHYRKVIKMNPSYEMSFNAKLNLASSFTGSSANKAEVKRNLQKMLKDDKNKEYLDQIYYAIGNLDLRTGDTTEAIVNYKKSAQASVDNDVQKTTSYLMLAELYLEQKSYKSSGLYYDSVNFFITESYPNYDEIMPKTNTMISLVTNLNVIEFEDSVQVLASMPERELMRVIDNAIKEYQEEERRKREEELLAMQQSNYYEYRLGNQNNQGAGKWYFYNPSNVSMGKKEFAAKWGERKLEDDWRRKNKEETSMGDFGEFEDPENAEGETEPAITDPKSREFYLQYIPLGDSAMEESDKRLASALLEVAYIYKDELYDYSETIKTYEDYVSRYPDSELIPLIYYQLYSISKQIEDLAAMNKYKQIVLSRYPESIYAKAIENPNFLQSLVGQKDEIETLFENTLESYKRKDYSSVLRNADYAQKTYPNSKKFIESFMYLKVLSIGETSSVSDFRDALNLFIEKYPQGIKSAEARNILAYLDNNYVEVKEEAKKEEAKLIYSDTISGTQHLLVLTDLSGDVNQLNFNIVAFNLDNLDSLNLSTEVVEGEQIKYVKVSSFNKIQSAIDYYKTIIEYDDLLNDVGQSKEYIFLINDDNLRRLEEDKDPERYYQFFKIKYKAE
jgi:tetratricopeptide (TPR) repeat protein